jgi:hypothetical protein
MAAASRIMFGEQRTLCAEQFAAGKTEASLGAIKAIPGEKASTTHWLRYSMATVFNLIEIVGKFP